MWTEVGTPAGKSFHAMDTLLSKVVEDGDQERTGESAPTIIRVNQKAGDRPGIGVAFEAKLNTEFIQSVSPPHLAPSDRLITTIEQVAIILPALKQRLSHLTILLSGSFTPTCPIRYPPGAAKTPSAAMLWAMQLPEISFHPRLKAHNPSFGF
jgi:hypothetical protein